MAIAGFAIGLLELLFFAFFAIAMVISMSLDRRGKNEPKWFVLIIGLIIAAIWYWKDWTFAGLWSMLFDTAFWMPFAIYLGIGLLYSIVEFMLEVRRSASFFKREWSSSKKSYNAQDFVARYRYSNKLVNVEYDPQADAPTPRVNKGVLAQSYSAWTFFWPFYLISLILGDFLTRVFELISDFITHISTGFVRVVFKDVFK